MNINNTKYETRVNVSISITDSGIKCQTSKHGDCETNRPIIRKHMYELYSKVIEKSTALVECTNFSAPL